MKACLLKPLLSIFNLHSIGRFPPPTAIGPSAAIRTPLLGSDVDSQSKTIGKLL